MTTKKTKKCNCVTHLEEVLRADNTELDLMFSASGKASIKIATKKIKSLRDGKKAKTVIATYCPFCGKKLEQ